MGIWPIPDDWIGFRICTNCGVKMKEGYMLAGEYTCCDECTIAHNKEMKNGYGLIWTRNG